MNDVIHLCLPMKMDNVEVSKTAPPRRSRRERHSRPANIITEKVTTLSRIECCLEGYNRMCFCLYSCMTAPLDGFNKHDCKFDYDLVSSQFG